MTTTQADTVAELQRANAGLRRKLHVREVERNAALARQAALAEELAARTAELRQRNTEYTERIEHQTATVDVLKAMSASPGDTQPVFHAIVRRARELCNGRIVTLYEFDDALIHYRANDRAGPEPEAHAKMVAMFPMAPTRDHPAWQAILDKHIIHIRDEDTLFRLYPIMRGFPNKSILAIPLWRDGAVIGAISLASTEPGGFSDSQIQLLKTFAEQAVIAISSAETYRALQTRTADLQETLEYQTATSDVLKVISRSTFDLQPLLNTVVKIAARLCDAERAVIYRREGELVRFVANFGFPSEFEAYHETLGPVPIDPYSPGVRWRSIVESRIVHIHDVTAVPGYPRPAITLGKQRTTLGVPLLRAGETIGTIVLARQRVEPFTDRQIQLVSTFADQAVIAIENTRLLTEQREALEQQTATAEVLQVINASPGDLTPVFDAMLKKATRLCGTAIGSFWSYNGEAFQVLASTIGDSGRTMQPGTNTALWRIAHGESVVQIADVETEPAYRVDAVGQMRTRLAGTRTALAVALRKDETLVGAITTGRPEVRPFTDKQIALLQNFAAQAVIAMENARLITEQGEALEQQTATAEVLQVINASPGDLQPVFDTMLEKALRLCGGTMGGIFTFDGDHSVTSAVRGVTAAFRQYNNKYPMDKIQPGTLPACIIETRGPVQYADVTASEPYRAGRPYARALVELGGIRATLAAPLLKDGVAVGMVAIYRQEAGAFSDKQIVLLENFAAQAVIAMENARLIDEQREALERQTAIAEVLQVINESPGKLEPVFDAILEKSMRLCDAAFGMFNAYDGTSFRTVVTRGVPRRSQSSGQNIRQSRVLAPLLAVLSIQNVRPMSSIGWKSLPTK